MDKTHLNSCDSDKRAASNRRRAENYRKHAKRHKELSENDPKFVPYYKLRKGKGQRSVDDKDDALKIQPAGCLVANNTDVLKLVLDFKKPQDNRAETANFSCNTGFGAQNQLEPKITEAQAWNAEVEATKKDIDAFSNFLFTDAEIFELIGSKSPSRDLLRDYDPAESMASESIAVQSVQGGTDLVTIPHFSVIEPTAAKKTPSKKMSQAVRACHQFSQLHNLTDTATVHLLGLMHKIRIGDITLNAGDIPKRIETYNKQIGGLETIPANIHWKCRKCSRYHKTAFENRLGSFNCCGTVAKHTDSHFFSLSLRQILLKTLPAIFSTINTAELNYAGFHRIRNEVETTDDDIFIAVNTDGIAITKSSTKSLWPILISVIGTPQQLRKDQSNMILQSQWVSSYESPDLNWLFTALVYELMEIELEPVVWNDAEGISHYTRVYLGYVCTDSMARFKVSGLQMHNGKYGCTFCTHQQSGHYFAHTEENPERTHSDYLAAFARQARDKLIEQQLLEPPIVTNQAWEEYRKKESEKYVLKHRSIICDLRYFDIIWGLPIDSMHTVSHGVFKLLLNSLIFPSQRLLPNCETASTDVITATSTNPATTAPIGLTSEIDMCEITWEDTAMQKFTQQSQAEVTITTANTAISQNSCDEKCAGKSRSKTLPLKKSDREKIDQFLKTIQPPNTFARYPRSLKDRAYFKAHEWYALAVIYLPVILEELLPTVVFNLYVQLIRAVEILSHHNRSEEQLEEATMCINIFSAGIANYFVDKAVTYNIHLLKHLPRCYRLYGPIYLYSLRYYENFNKRIVGFTSSNQFTAVHAIRRYANSVVDPPDPSIFKNSSKSAKIVLIDGISFSLASPLPRKPEHPKTVTYYGKLWFIAQGKTVTVKALPSDSTSVRHNSSCFITTCGKVVEVTRICLDSNEYRLRLFCKTFNLQLWLHPLDYIFEGKLESEEDQVQPNLILKQCIRINRNKRIYFFNLFNSVDLNLE